MLARNVTNTFLIRRREIDTLRKFILTRNYMLAYNVQNVFLISRQEIDTLEKFTTMKRDDTMIRKDDMIIHTIHAFLLETIS